MPAAPALSARALLADAAASLAAAGVPSAEHDAAALLASATGRTPTGLLLDPAVPEPARARFRALVARRAAREPLQHLTGTAGFRRLELVVGPGVFVPRPETEVVAGAAVEEAARVAAERPAPGPVVVDLCAGSGAIALAVADEVPGAVVHAVEADPAAVAYAARNLALLLDSWRAAAGPRSPQPAVTLHEWEVARVAAPGGPLAGLRGTVDVVVANPPYLPEAVREHLEPEVLADPPAALFGGPDGLAVVATVVAVAAVLLRPGGLLVCEHDAGSAAEARALLGPGWAEVSSGVDLVGRPRYVRARRVPAR